MTENKNSISSSGEAESSTLNTIPSLTNIPFENPKKIVNGSNSLDKLKSIDDKFYIIKKGRKGKNFNSGIINDRRVHNKFCNDNIRRRIKALFNNYIIKLLNNLLKKNFIGTKMKFVKINIRKTKDVGIKYNRNLLDKTIRDIITNVSNKYLNQDNNIKCIKYIESHKNNEEIINVLNKTYKDLYVNYYLKSSKNDILDNSFEAHKQKILGLYGKEYSELFIKNAYNFIEFFAKGKNRKPRRLEEVDTIDIPLEETLEIKSSEELKNINDGTKTLKNKEKISVYTQTDICGINTKLISFT